MNLPRRRLLPLEDLDVGPPARVEVEADPPPVLLEAELHRQPQDLAVEDLRLREVAREDADVGELPDPDHRVRYPPSITSTSPVT